MPARLPSRCINIHNSSVVCHPANPTIINDYVKLIERSSVKIKQAISISKLRCRQLKHGCRRIKARYPHKLLLPLSERKKHMHASSVCSSLLVKLLILKDTIQTASTTTSTIITSCGDVEKLLRKCNENACTPLLSNCLLNNLQNIVHVKLLFSRRSFSPSIYAM